MNHLIQKYKIIGGKKQASKFRITDMSYVRINRKIFNFYNYLSKHATIKYKIFAVSYFSYLWFCYSSLFNITASGTSLSFGLLDSENIR